MECHKDYVKHIFRAILSGQNSNFNHFIEKSNNDWDTVTGVLKRDLIQNSTDKYNTVEAAK